MRKRWKKILTLVIVLPLIAALGMALFWGVVYVQWQSDKDMALARLARYKKLIDRTEDLRRGTFYSSSDVDTSARVVDLPTRIYDRHGELIGEFFDQKREIVPFNTIPQWVVKGVVASEDREFYNHHGISYKGIFRAMVKNIMHFRVVQGGSTITQQLAKVLFTDMERSFRRKIYEAYCATDIEKIYDKQDILSMYLNLIYFGNGAYGVQAASKMFFGMPVSRCGIAESAMIVSTISNPKYYSPLSNVNNSVVKTSRILQSLADAGYISKKRGKREFKLFLRRWDISKDSQGKYSSKLIGTFLHSSYRVNRAPFFNERIRRFLVAKFGEAAVKKGGLSVYTTLDGVMQDKALESLRIGINRQRNYHKKRAKRIRNAKRRAAELEKAENIEGAFITVDPHSGEVISWCGGSAFTARNQNDHVSQVFRQPGSSIKPLVYAAALEKRVITPSTRLSNRKVTFSGNYTPENYDKKYSDFLIAREALVHSANIPAVHVLKKTGFKPVLSYINKGLYNISEDTKKRFQPTLSLALGAYEISPLEGAVLHSLLVNGGKYIYPYGITLVKDYNQKVIYDNKSDIDLKVTDGRNRYHTIIDPAAGAITLSMLRGIFDTGGSLYRSYKGYGLTFQAAGKTGTTSNFVDAWFVGYTSRTVSIVWIGNKAGAISLGPGRSGGGVSAPVWLRFAAKVLQPKPPEDFTIPYESVTVEKICLDSGLVARPHGTCPRVAPYQLYYSGSEPGEYCDIHKPANEEKSSEQ